MRRAGILAVVLLAHVAFAAQARAEPVQIISGALYWNGAAETNPVALSGPGFTFLGTLGNGIFQPWEDCNATPECTAGGTVDLRAFYVGLDIYGTAVYDGRLFTQVGGLTSNSSLTAEWNGSLLIPSGFTGGDLTAPFFFDGTFAFQNGVITRVPLTGVGTATLTFAPYVAYPGAFFLEEARYEFAPTPEPASLLLIGTGLAGLVAARRRRRAGDEVR